MTIDKAYIYKRKDGETIFCYGELNEGDNIDITLDCDADELDGVACDIDVTDPKTNTWRKICEYLEINYSSKIVLIIEFILNNDSDISKCLKLLGCFIDKNSSIEFNINSLSQLVITLFS